VAQCAGRLVKRAVALEYPAVTTILHHGVNARYSASRQSVPLFFVILHYYVPNNAFCSMYGIYHSTDRLLIGQDASLLYHRIEIDGVSFLNFVENRYTLTAMLFLALELSARLPNLAPLYTTYIFYIIVFYVIIFLYLLLI
jgi:hypothetical protein